MRAACALLLSVVGQSAGDSRAAVTAANLSMTTIDQFYASRHCIVCDGLTPAKQPICQLCVQTPQLTMSVLMVCHALILLLIASAFEASFIAASACSVTVGMRTWDVLAAVQSCLKFLLGAL